MKNSRNIMNERRNRSMGSIADSKGTVFSR
jgi:hypothetical protein